MKLMLSLFILLGGCAQSYKKAPLLAGHKRSQHEAYADNYMIATQGEAATRAGIKMFELGGNAYDAFAAISFAISVERPQSTGLGGGGFLVHYSHQMKKVEAVDFREKSPLKGHAKMFLDVSGQEIKGKSLDGIFAGGVPGLVAGVVEVHQKYGKLPLKTVIGPAIDLAENGVEVYPHLASAIEKRKDVLAKYPASKRIFLKKVGEGYRAYEVGEILVQRDLGRTLRSIAALGKKGFYDGWVAAAIVKESRMRGGLIRDEDLKKYNVKFRQPVKGSYKGYEIFSMGPPSSGGIHVIQILNMVEQDELKKWGVHAPESIHLLASSMQQAFADRAKYLGDADFVSVPATGLISKSYARDLRKKISISKARTSKKVFAGNPLPYESDETTHFTIMDKEGNTISSTQTINGYMGSALVIPGTGIVLNNEMDDFSTKPGALNLFGAVGSAQNLVQPEKRPLSSMSPTIVMKNGQPLLALGTPSGTRILSCVMQTILNYLEYELPLYDAVAAWRYHHQWQPDQIFIEGEGSGFSESTMTALKSKGHKLFTRSLGCKVQAVAMEAGRLHGVSDPRGEGQAYGN